MIEIVVLKKRHHSFDKQFCLCNGLDGVDGETFVKVFFPEDNVWRTFKAKCLVRLDNLEDIISIEGFEPKLSHNYYEPKPSHDCCSENFKRNLACLIKAQVSQIELLVDLIKDIG